MNRKYARHALLLLFPLLFAGCFKTRQEIAREKEDSELRSNLQQNMVDYNQSIEKTQAEVGRLQGRIEELEHQRRKEMTGYTTSREGDQKTIEELRAKVSALQEAQNALFEEVKRLREDSIASSAPARTPPASGAGAKKKVDKPRFSDAMTAYKAKDYATSAGAFRAYLDANPRSKQALDARFYLADSLFLQKNFEQAVVEFGAVHEKTPTSPLGRRATLRLAQSFQAMGKTKDARAFAQLLIQGSPESAEARTARKLLK